MLMRCEQCQCLFVLFVSVCYFHLVLVLVLLASINELAL